MFSIGGIHREQHLPEHGIVRFVNGRGIFIRRGDGDGTFYPIGGFLLYYNIVVQKERLFECKGYQGGDHTTFIKKCGTNNE